MDSTLYYLESSLKRKDDDRMNNGAYSTVNDMTDNPAYGTTSGMMATTVNPWINEGDKSIVMHKNPTYSTAARTMPEHI